MEFSESNIDTHTKRIMEAAEHFGLELNDVEPHHVNYIRTIEFARNYGGRGAPLRSYTVTEEGVVDFTEESKTELLTSSQFLFPEIE